MNAWSHAQNFWLFDFEFGYNHPGRPMNQLHGLSKLKFLMENENSFNLYIHKVYLPAIYFGSLTNTQIKWKCKILNSNEGFFIR